MAFETKVPGLKTAHLWSTEQCWLRDGAEMDEVIEKLRKAYDEVKIAPSNVHAKIHFVMTVDWPEDKTDG